MSQAISQEKAAVRQARDALGLYKKGDVEAAIAMLEDAHKLASTNGEILTALGALVSEKGDQEKAIQLLRKALRLGNSPKNVVSYNLACAFHRKGGKQLFLLFIVLTVNSLSGVLRTTG